jgi:hypothetical protein
MNSYFFFTLNNLKMVINHLSNPLFIGNFTTNLVKDVVNSIRNETKTAKNNTPILASKYINKYKLQPISVDKESLYITFEAPKYVVTFSTNGSVNMLKYNPSEVSGPTNRNWTNEILADKVKFIFEHQPEKIILDTLYENVFQTSRANGYLTKLNSEIEAWNNRLLELVESEIARANTKVESLNNF